MHLLLTLGVAVVSAILGGAAILHLIPKLGGVGRAMSPAFCRAPGVDVVLLYFIVGPWIAGPVVAGWWGLLVGVIAQYAALLIWIALHELAHPGARKGPRIHSTMRRLVGGWRNHFAVWVTSLAVPAFWVVRAAEVFLYPVLTWTVRLPTYRHAEWVAVSRHKFEGLVGYDLIWCLYCDWMTGVWSLGGEMLRNVESVWCPFRFYSEKKCANCRIDFPDIEGGWVPADGAMADVARVLEEKYPRDEGNSWYGHPVRVTREGSALSDQPSAVG